MKEINENRSWELITKKIGNELSAQEEQELNQWLEEDMQHRKELEYAQKIWQLSDQKEIDAFDTEIGWKKMDHRIHNPFKQKKNTGRMVYITLSKIAAACLVLCVLAYLIVYMVGKSDYTTITASTRMKNTPIILADGTKVYLNTGAALSYPKKFGTEARIVKLTGEAFFDVTPNKKIPFIIQTPKANIRVVGTSFNVLACNRCDSVQVAVKTGIVELSSTQSNDKISISKGNTGVIYLHPNKLKVSTTDINMNSFAWKTDSIIFQDSHLFYVTQTLERIFGEKITISNEKLKNCPINATFKDQDLAKILETMKVTHGIRVNKTTKGYLLTGSECK
jgi:transmembrane sensor